MEPGKITEWLKERLREPLPGIKAQELMAGRVLPMPHEIPASARPSAVLCLLYLVNDELSVLLMRRTADKGAHSGQISFPGGKKELTDDSLEATALREAQEEIGIIPSEISVLGGLTPLYIPVSNYKVYPFIAYAPERPTINPSPDEVASTIELPLSILLNAERKTQVDVISPAVAQVIRKVNAYKLEDGTIIWGATAMIISELEVVLGEYPV